MSSIQTVGVYCASSEKSPALYLEAAARLGRALASSRLAIVYGGGSQGSMGRLAAGALEAGGKVTGVLPRFMDELEWGHRSLTELRVVDSMHERKLKMGELSDGFIALPGGMGTLDELSEVLTWAQLGMHHKPIGALNVQGYFAGFLQQMAHAVEEQLLKPEYRGMLQVAETPAALLQLMRDYRPPQTMKWVERPRA